ncbi:MAG: PilX N-terminal domain-containing pilus assembly protein, partial [Pseudomonadales bacterium]
MNRCGLGNPQRGIALLLALVVLLLVTILGLVGLESAVLELRMAGAQREYALAYQPAQGALNDGERVL